MLRRTLMDRVHGPLAGQDLPGPAAAGDEPLLYRIYESTRGEELQLFDWDPAQITAFLELQFTAQNAFYYQHFPDSGYELILLNDEPVGRLFSTALATKSALSISGCWRNTATKASVERSSRRSLTRRPKRANPCVCTSKSSTVPNGFTSGSALCRSLSWSPPRNGVCAGSTRERG